MGNSNTAVDVDPFVSSNNVKFCLPCNKQDNKNHAVYWCISCPELLCQTCYGHHKALKATQDHKLLKIDDYHMIGSSLADSISHWRNVQLKEDCLKKKDINQDLSTTIKTMTTTIENVRTDLLNNQWNISALEKQKTLFHTEMIIGRHRVDTFLNEFESDVRQKYEIAFSTSKQIVQENISKIEHKLNVLQKRTETAENIREFDFSESQMNLINKKFQQDNIEDNMQIENLINGMKNVSIVANPVFTVNEVAKQITLSNGFRVCHHNGSHNQPEIGEIESSSSTIEAEADLQ
ncbi:uncharacterized protein LOC134683086 [Mytilus trossulus]|uniref:uncharacterized protein LOC134683086 n=1 Tax=Mytilus trossulus TaxID=6551 RepID=UPI0030053218